MSQDDFTKWITENKISFETDIVSSREVETMYDKGFIPTSYKEYEFFESYKDVKPIHNKFTILYNNILIEIDFEDDGTDLLSQCKNEIEKAIRVGV